MRKILLLICATVWVSAVLVSAHEAASHLALDSNSLAHRKLLNLQEIISDLRDCLNHDNGLTNETRREVIEQQICNNLHEHRPIDPSHSVGRSISYSVVPEIKELIHVLYPNHKEAHDHDLQTIHNIFSITHSLVFWNKNRTDLLPWLLENYFLPSEGGWLIPTQYQHIIARLIDDASRNRNQPNCTLLLMCYNEQGERIINDEMINEMIFNLERQSLYGKNDLADYLALFLRVK